MTTVRFYECGDRHNPHAVAGDLIAAQAEAGKSIYVHIPTPRKAEAYYQFLRTYERTRDIVDAVEIGPKLIVPDTHAIVLFEAAELPSRPEVYEDIIWAFQSRYQYPHRESTNVWLYESPYREVHRAWRACFDKDWRTGDHGDLQVAFFTSRSIYSGQDHNVPRKIAEGGVWRRIA